MDSITTKPDRASRSGRGQRTTASGCTYLSQHSTRQTPGIFWTFAGVLPSGQGRPPARAGPADGGRADQRLPARSAEGQVGQWHFGKRRPSVTDHEEQQPEPVGLDADQLWRFRGASYPRSRPDLSRQRRPVLKPPFSRAVRTVAWDPVRGCGCRSRAVRLSVPKRLPGRRGPARALPSRRVARGRETRAAARAVRRDVSGDDFTRVKPSWPSPACEPPVRSKPAPAGRLLKVGCRHHTPGTQQETPPPPEP